MTHRNRPVENPEPDSRRTVIPTPKTDGIFRGWGVRF